MNKERLKILSILMYLWIEASENIKDNTEFADYYYYGFRFYLKIANLY